MFVRTFRNRQRRYLHGYFDAIEYAFYEFVRQPSVAELIIYSDRREYRFLINGNNRSGLFKGVVMRISKYFFCT